MLTVAGNITLLNCRAQISMSYNMYHTAVSQPKPFSLCALCYAPSCAGVNCHSEQQLCETSVVFWIYTMVPLEHGAFTQNEDMAPNAFHLLSHLIQ